MNTEQVIAEIGALITKGAKAADGGEALRYTQAASNASNALRCALDSAQLAPKSGLTDDQIKHMVGQFLGWSLPETFAPDGGISFKRSSYKDEPYPMPNGTNIFDYTQATAMVRHMIEGLPPPA